MAPDAVDRSRVGRYGRGRLRAPFSLGVRRDQLLEKAPSFIKLLSGDEALNDRDENFAAALGSHHGELPLGRT